MSHELEETENDGEKLLSGSSKKLVDLIVKIIVNSTFRELEMENKAEQIQENSKIKKCKRGSNKKK